MLRTTAIAKELAVIERKLQETTNKTLKDALKKKQARLKDELNDAKKSTPQLAKKLLAQKQQVKALSKVDFNDLVRRLSKKPEYSFLKTMPKSKVRTDIERPAKPVGWRFKGRGNYDKPTLAEIKKGKRNGTVYREVRPLRSDVSQPLRLEHGGTIEIGDKVKASKEYGGKSGTVIDKRGSFVVVKYSNGESDSYHESDLVKKMENGGMIKIGDKVKLNDDGVIRTYTVTNPGMRHPSERLQEGDVYLTSPGVIGFDASIDWVKENMIHDKMSTGGGVREIKSTKDLNKYLVYKRPGFSYHYIIGDYKFEINEFNDQKGWALNTYKKYNYKGKEDWELVDTYGYAGFTLGGCKQMILQELENENKMAKGGNMKNTHMMEEGDKMKTGGGVEEIKDVDYIWREQPSLVKIIKVKQTSKGNYSGLFSYTDENRTKWEKLDKFFGKSLFDGKYEKGGIIGQEIVFDDNGEENTGVIKDIHEITGNYIVATDDGRTVLADKELDVISLGKIREVKAKKSFSFFEDGGNIAKENNEMLHSQAKEAKHHIEELHNIINNKTKVEPWVVAKMTRAKTDLSDITHYLEGASHKMSKGGKLTDAQQEKFNKVMHEWKQGKLHSGSPNGPIVKDQDQAIAIAYAEAYGSDKMLFGGMVNDLSDDTIDRMEGLVPISTLQELLDNAKFIIADMYEEGFEKDEIMSFLAYKISQIGGSKNSNRSSGSPSRHKAQVLVDLYNELSDAKNIESLEWDYDADEGHFIIFENGLESTSPKHKGQNDQFTFYADKDGKIIAGYILNGSVKSNLTVKEALEYARANEDVQMATGGGVGGESKYEDGGLTRGQIEDKIEGLKLRIAKTKKQISLYETAQRGKYNKLFQEKVVPLQKELSNLSELWGKAKYAKGGGVGSLAPNLLMELWYAVWERKTDKYDDIAKKLDKEGVSFTIQNKVAEDAQNTRSRKAIDTFEVQDRIKKIMGNTMMATGGGVGKIIIETQPQQSLSDKQIKLAKEIANEVVKTGLDATIEYDSGTIDVKIIYGNKFSQALSTGRFRVFWSRTGDNKIQYLGVGSGYYDGHEIKRGWSNDLSINEVQNIVKKEKDYYDARKYATGGGVGSKKQDYVEVTNGDTILSLEKTNGVWEEVDVLQGVKPFNFGRNTYKGNLDAKALVNALNKEYGGGYRISYVFMNGGQMNTGGGLDGMSTVNEIARLSGLRAVAVAEWGDKNNINLTTILKDLKAKKIKGMDLMTAVVGKPGNKYSKELVAKYSKMAKGGKATGWKHKNMA